MDLNKLSKFKQYYNDIKIKSIPILQNYVEDSMNLLKKGGSIKIKKENKGKFTDYCRGKVTEECIRRGKNSSNPITRKRATFADNARKWNK